MNNYEISVGMNNKISILSEKFFSTATLSQITQTINSSVNGEPKNSIDEWFQLDGCRWKDFIYVSGKSFQEVKYKLLEKLSKSNTSSKRGYFVSCLFDGIEMCELDAIFKFLTEKADVDEIVWANSVPENDEQPFISLVLLDQNKNIFLNPCNKIC